MGVGVGVGVGVCVGLINSEVKFEILKLIFGFHSPT